MVAATPYSTTSCKISFSVISDELLSTILFKISKSMLADVPRRSLADQFVTDVAMKVIAWPSSSSKGLEFARNNCGIDDFW